MEINEFQKAQRERILGCYGETKESILEKGGEGSRGGHIIGHTSTDKPIYEGTAHHLHADFTPNEHREAIEVHKQKNSLVNKVGIAHHEAQIKKKEGDRISISTSYGDGKFSSEKLATNPAGKLTKPQNYSVVKMNDGSFVRTTNNRASQFAKQGDGEVIGKFDPNQEFSYYNK